jgi:hypothetical protein
MTESFALSNVRWLLCDVRSTCFDDRLFNPSLCTELGCLEVNSAPLLANYLGAFHIGSAKQVQRTSHNSQSAFDICSVSEVCQCPDSGGELALQCPLQHSFINPPQVVSIQKNRDGGRRVPSLR